MTPTRSISTTLAAAAAILMLAGAGHAHHPARGHGWATKGLVYVVHENDVQKMKIVFHTPAGDKTHATTQHFSEVRRIRVLAVKHGAPTRLEITYVKVGSPKHSHPTEQQARGHSFVVTRAAKTGGHPAVTEKGKAVTGKLAEKVRQDVAGDLDAAPRTAWLHEAMAHPGKKVSVPDKAVTFILGGDPNVKKAHDQVAFVKREKGRIHLKLWARHLDSDGEMHLKVTMVGPVVLAARTGRLLSEHLVPTARGKAQMHSPMGIIHADLIGGGLQEMTIAYHPAK